MLDLITATKEPPMTAADAQQARDLLREDAPRTPAEQAALDVLNEHKWALWHSHDRDLAVMLLLSRKGLLRDREYERRQDEMAVSNMATVQRERTADAVRLSALHSAIEQGCSRLDAGEDSAVVAAWLKQVRAAAS